jgi:hypothetical protein
VACEGLESIEGTEAPGIRSRSEQVHEAIGENIGRDYEAIGVIDHAEFQVLNRNS